MDKKTLYIALFNAFLGVMVSLLLKGNLLIYALVWLGLMTLVVMERKWIFQNIFRQNIWAARVGYCFLFAGMVLSFLLLTDSNLEVKGAVKTLKAFFNQIKQGKYESAYLLLSKDSQNEYPLTAFVTDHASIKIKHFRIDEAKLNEFNENKITLKVSSPFLIYGEKSQEIELVKEDEDWKIVLSQHIVHVPIQSPETVPTSSPPKAESVSITPLPAVGTKTSPASKTPPKEKKKGGAVTNFFKKLF